MYAKDDTVFFFFFLKSAIAGAFTSVSRKCGMHVVLSVLHILTIEVTMSTLRHSFLGDELNIRPYSCVFYLCTSSGPE
jgi:hypothetical protein